MNRDWHQLRTLDGSQHKAFEELCCQLAAYEPAPQGAKFTRVGAPDAGVECYWTLPGGDEWAWQAKFFTGLPDEGQWRQIDQSVQTALTRHPRLTSSRFLRENDLALIWTVRGEKQFVGGPRHSGSFIGRLHVTGAYGMAADGQITGGYSSQIFSP